MSDKIVPLFGQFAVQIDGETQLFDTEDEAKVALSAFENGAENLKMAQGYVGYKGYSDKNASGKINIITDFLTWVDAGSPVAPPAEVPAETTTEGGKEAGDGDDQVPGTESTQF